MKTIVTDTYETVPLPLGSSTNFRVLYIEPCSKPESEIFCNLQVRIMKPPPPYIALSYTWGEPTPTRTIQLNRKPFQIRQNLWDFLVEARTRALTTMIWVDALCIDQTQDSERSHQVSMMDRIYSTARHVIVWLGRATAFMERTLPAIRIAYFEQLEINGVINLKGAGYVTEEFSMAVRDICERQYWNRVWILQEFAPVRKIVMWYGSQVVDEIALMWLLKTGKPYPRNVLPSAQSQLLEEEDWAQQFNRVMSYRSTLQVTNYRQCLEYVLARFGGNMGCSDSRDGLFALLSLIDPEEIHHLGLTTDYTKSAEEIFQDTWNAIRKIIRQDLWTGLRCSQGIVFYFHMVLP